MKCLASLAALLAAAALATASAQSATADDPFRPLENLASPESQAFFREQAEKARAALEKIPGRAAMLDRIHALSEAGTAVTRLKLGGNRIFYLKLSPGHPSPVLYVRDSLASAERRLVDPETFSRGAAPAAIDWYAPSHDGRHVAYGISRGGSEDSTLRVIQVDAARDTGLEIDRTRFNTELAWHPDSRSFYYSRIPEGNSGLKRYANIRVYRHVLGRETARDEIVFAPGVGGARDVPEFVYPSLHVPEDSRFAYAIVREGVRNEIAVHVSPLVDVGAGRPRWTKVVAFEDDVTAIEGWKDELYLLSHKDAPHSRVLRLDARAPVMARARVVVPQGDSVITAIGLARDGLYLRTMVAGVDRLEKMALGLLAAKQPRYVRTPFDTAISQLVTHPRRPGALLRMQGWIEPPAIMEVDAKTENLRDTGIQPRVAADFSTMDEVRLYATAHDGVKIPVTLIYKKSTQLNRDNPTVITAYGAYGITLSPAFDPARLAWLERGGIFAVAHVRGGGEYGEGWYKAGRKATKINTILDFISVADFLVSYGFTSPKRLAIMGASAGGIPVGGALVRKPELFAAAVARVPVMDMVRFEAMANGAPNIPEFGSAATPEGLEALRVMSAYHHVKDGVPYPGVLLTAGFNDPRVDAWQPGKMAARLQQATTSGRPVLLRMDFEAGHGLGASKAQREAELADIYSFMLWQMGDPAFQPPAPPQPPPPPPPVEAPPPAPAKPESPAAK